jgi:hypothetical protein
MERKTVEVDHRPGAVNQSTARRWHGYAKFELDAGWMLPRRDASEYTGPMPHAGPLRILALISLFAIPAEAHAATAIDATAGSDHACVLDGGGTASCWGHNFHGQLGTGDNTDRLTPAAVAGLGSGVASISAGRDYTCAVTSSGGAKCWGRNQYRTLGDGTTTPSSSPVDVTGLTNGVAAIAGGTDSTCALTTGGGVKCWGINARGQLGDGLTATSATPVDVTGLTSGVVAIDVGDSHACAVTAAGGVKCWGKNDAGQLGDGTITDRLSPVDVSGLSSGVVAVSAGFLSTCALTSAGGVKCWGYNGDGNVGDGTAVDRHVPTDVIGLASGVLRITSELDGTDFANANQTCAVTDTGALLCWGGNVVVPAAVRLFDSGVARVASGASLWIVTSGGDLRLGSFPKQGTFAKSGYGPLASRWSGGCLLGFGDADGDALCETYDACDSEHVRQRFPVFKTPKSKLSLTRINTETIPGNDQMILRGRFELPAGKSFDDLAPGTTGARIVLVSPKGVTASFAMPAGTYAGRGTAGWTFVASAKPRWQFKDSTGAPGTKTITTLKLTGYGPGTIGDIVDVNLTARAGSFPVGPGDAPLQALVLLDDVAPGAGGLCGQGAFDCDCRFGVGGKALTCDFGRHTGQFCSTS